VAPRATSRSRTGSRRSAARGDYVHAAKSAVAFADLLLSRRRTGGCFDPDEICALADIEPVLSRAGIAIVPRGLPLASPRQ